jgi:branched-chain amino acid transport system permease protein
MTNFIQLLIDGVLTGSIYALIALGFSLIYKVTGVVNLAQGAFCVLAALICWSLEQQAGLPIGLACLGAVAATVAVGAIVGAVSFVPGLTRLSNANMLMLTAGLLTVFEGAMQLVWGSQPYTVEAFSGQAPLSIGGIHIPSQGLWMIAATLSLVGGLWLLLVRTRIGQALRACSENPTAARLMGVNVRRMTLFSFCLAAFIAAIAGVVIAPATSLQFDSGRMFTVSGFIAAVIGGISSLPGAIIGGLLLGVVNSLATAYLSSLYSNAIALGFLLVMLVWRPNGLLSSGPARRSDVREEARVWTRIHRLAPQARLYSAVAFLVVAVTAPLLVSNSILNSFVIAGILYVALLGLDVLMGYCGQVALGQAGFMAIGGYTAAGLATAYDLPPLLGIAAGIALSLVCALVLSLVTLRLRGLYLALATLSFGLLVTSFAVGLTDMTGGPSGMVGIPALEIGGFAFDSTESMYFLVLVLNVVLVLALGGVMRSSFGRALQAIRTDQMAAAALGVNVIRYKLIAFCTSAALASLAGSLYAFHFHFLSPDMVDATRSLELVAMLVVGGEGTLIGPFLGSLLLTLLPLLFGPLASAKTLITGLLLVGCFLHLPHGLFGLVVEGLNALFRRRPSEPPPVAVSREAAR